MKKLKQTSEMRNQFLTLTLLILMLSTFSSCAVVGGIFKAGMGFGIFMVILVLALVVFLISRMGKNK